VKPCVLIVDDQPANVRLMAEALKGEYKLRFATSGAAAIDVASGDGVGFDAGGVDYITKPAKPAIVRARVRTHLELKRSRDLLAHLAMIDPLTGIPNRRRFDSSLELEWQRAARNERWLSLAILDVDYFCRTATRCPRPLFRPRINCSTRPRRPGARTASTPTCATT
jgi:PleD family two-component response regulator